MEIFGNNDYKYISKLVEDQIPILRKNEDFNQKYLALYEKIEELEKTLAKEQKEKLDEIIQLFYETEEYYFTFSYTLGVKYGEEIKKL